MKLAPPASGEHSCHIGLTTPVNLVVRSPTGGYDEAVCNESANFSITPAAPRTFGATIGFHSEE